jgi:hypothetical protein
MKDKSHMVNAAYERRGDGESEIRSFPDIGGCTGRRARTHVKHQTGKVPDHYEMVWNIYASDGSFLGLYFESTKSLSLATHIGEYGSATLKTELSGLDSVENAVRIAYLKWEQKKNIKKNA